MEAARLVDTLERMRAEEIALSLHQVRRQAFRTIRVEIRPADAKAGHTHYTSSLGYPELRQGIVDMYRDD